jgi:hypothetical protein
MDQSSSDIDRVPNAAASPAPETASVWEDFLDILYAPSAVFARREHGSFWIPMLVVTVFLGTLFLVNGRVWDSVMAAESQRAMAAMAQNRDITPEMMAQIEQMQGATRTFSKVMMFLTIPFIVFFVGVLTWLVGKMFGAQQTFHAALVVGAYAYVPKVIDGLLAALQGLFLDPSQFDGKFRVTLGPGRFLDPDTASPMLVELLGRLDVFTIWVTVLIAIGLAVTGRISRGRAAMAAAVIWLIGALPGVAGALSR